ncbi:MAG: hypothetical protein ACI4GX_07315, partial [Ruminococcus sp.]
EGKRAGKRTLLQYLEKNTGVFNQYGMIPKEEVKAMQERARANEGYIWHGFISLNKHDSVKINTPEKCIDLVKRTFPTFFRECRMSEKNIDLMCALHVDKPEHFHIHFVFWEKEPRHKGKSGVKEYRAKGNMPKQAIDNMFVRLGLFVGEDKGTLPKARDNALQRLRDMTAFNEAVAKDESIRREIIALSKVIPQKGRTGYGTPEMQPYRGRVDKIVKMILDYDKVSRQANLKFYMELDKKRKEIANICGKPYALTAGKNPDDVPVYHHKIDEGNIKIVETIEEDYKRRQGNLIINLAKAIKPEYYERNKNVRYKANDNRLKRKLAMSSYKLSRKIKSFFKSFGQEHRVMERDFSRRLQEIEEEMKAEKKRQEQETAKNNYKGANYKD